MKFLKLFILIIPFYGFGQKIISDDVNNFWKAYDKIVLEKDSTKQIELIKTYYINKGTPGLDGIMRARNYSAEEYVFAINHYPKFWNSVRKNTLKASQFSNEIQKGINKLNKIYPDLKPKNTYFEIGILRTNGTIIDDMALIGSEVALTDKSVVTSEFDGRYPHLRNYFDTDPIKNVVFLNVHEYVHTQQKTTLGNTVLAQSVLEGVAEFLAETALNKKSPNTQIEFGYKNEHQIKTAFEKEMFSPFLGNWIWNNPNNQFGMRDLAYFVGYAICKKYYDENSDKKTVVKEIIELDYNNENELEKFVEKTKYFAKPLNFYKNEFENLRPKVLEIKEFKNGSQNVDPATKTITLTFSQPMNVKTRGFDYGPLGENNVLKVQKVIGFSEDKKSFSFEVDLKESHHYQSTVMNFRDENNFPVTPFLIDFKTAD